jgi:predicted glutamine amidotransferase
MCLAIYKPADTAPDWTAYENGHDSNKDSWGFAAVVDGQLVTCCGLGKFEEFREAFEPYANRQAIIHFRWATHGKTNEDNCHPFMVADNLAVIHNGVVAIKCEVNQAMSDTWHFNELVLKPMHDRDPDFYNRSEVIFTQELAHDSSKFVFLRADGDYCIWNADDGEWEKDGHWYSNNSYEESRWARYRYASTPSTPSKSIGFESSIRSDAAYRYDDDADEREWRREAEACVSTSPFEDEDDEADAYTQIRVDDLRKFGVSAEVLDEVLTTFGPYGIEALHDIM